MLSRCLGKAWVLMPVRTAQASPRVLWRAEPWARVTFQPLSCPWDLERTWGPSTGPEGAATPRLSQAVPVLARSPPSASSFSPVPLGIATALSLPFQLCFLTFSEDSALTSLGWAQV